jgi:membrane protein
MTRRQRFFKMLTLGFKHIRNPYYQGFAAQLAFFYMMSIVPTFLLISEAAGFFFRSDLKKALGWLIKYLNLPFGGVLNDILLGGSSVPNNILMIIIALWAASRAQFSMARICNFMFSDGQDTGEYWHERFRSLKTMAWIIIAMILVLLVMMIGSSGLQYVLSSLGFSTDWQHIWRIIRWPIALFLYILMLAYNYKVLPKKKMKWREVFPGALFAGFGLLAITFIYALYLNDIADYNILYGSLSTIIALMFWFWFLAWVMVLGELFNKVWLETADYKDWTIEDYYTR